MNYEKFIEKKIAEYQNFEWNSNTFLDAKQMIDDFNSDKNTVLNHLLLYTYARQLQIKSTIDFLTSPSEEKYINLADAVFYQLSACLIMKNDDASKKVGINQIGLSSLLMACIIFLGEKEIKLMLDFLLYQIDRDVTIKKAPILYQNSILQEAIRLTELDNSEALPNQTNVYNFESTPLIAVIQDLINVTTEPNSTKVNDSIKNAEEFHIKKSKDSSFSNEFFYPEWQILAAEILAPVKIRQEKKYDINTITGSSVISFIPFFNRNDGDCLSEKTSRFRVLFYQKYNL